ncbi:hypothetical protein AAIA71_28680 (plasmid) [Vibrio harveyi]|uniref:hypothetical protein n=1 Tax=Vibrio harveyi TaxID=669 RepID=UPI0031B9C496
MIDRLECLYDTQKAAEKVVGEHFELMNGNDLQGFVYELAKLQKHDVIEGTL